MFKFIIGVPLPPTACSFERTHPEVDLDWESYWVYVRVYGSDSMAAKTLSISRIGQDACKYSTSVEVLPNVSRIEWKRCSRHGRAKDGPRLAHNLNLYCPISRIILNFPTSNPTLGAQSRRSSLHNLFLFSSIFGPATEDYYINSLKLERR